MVTPPPRPNIQPSPQPHKDSRGLRRWVIGCFVFVPIFCCGGSALFARKWIDIFDYSADLDHQVAEAKKHGLPMESSEMALKPAVKDEDNGFLVLKKVMTKYPDDTKVRQADSKFLPGPGKRTPEILRNMADETMPIAEKAGYDAHHDFDNGPFELYPEYSFLKNGVRSLSKVAIQDAFDGNFKDAVRRTAAIQWITSLITHERQLIGCLVCISLNSILTRTATRVADKAASDPEVISQLKAILEKPNFSPNIHEAFLGEFFNGVTVTRNFRALGGIKALSQSESESNPVSLKNLRKSGLPNDQIARGMLGSWIDKMIHAKDILDREPSVMKSTKEIDTFMTKVPMTMSNSLPLILIPVWKQAGEAFERNILGHKLAIQAIDLIVAAKHHALPREIKELPDPFSDSYVIYSRTANGFLLYSVGPNGKDDGGPRNKTSRKNSDDYGYDYPFVTSQ